MGPSLNEWSKGWRGEKISVRLKAERIQKHDIA
jgi:hypothetical protein